MQFMDKSSILKQMYFILFPVTLFLSLNIYQWIVKSDYSFTGYIIQNLIIVALALVAAIIAYLITKKNI
ncbi:TPA: hypothetical protein QCW10_006192 [Bacillus thuringiensis]|uniref:Uncharacterized protein n=5 Tax=Bacteria TaxID=2 RepID=A0A643LKY4_BACTU|nr:hypothetical protein [Xenorhabdus sp. Reich]AFV22211.1 hypothetical protein BTB_9p00080 [Bacillus thuringiensis Bt407]AJK44476.1 putative membrane protein [Bacillus thuringiensis serovar kurstaki]AKJ63086.1 hypothetical protein XI92_33630 [Bacillus thuringiensis]EJQ01671.1 hypothetical protein IE3_05712 [Bacillus cereus BAG3X2-1]EJV71767.1 hypothetical protein IG1_05977 [Bacillus cereus HD73]EOP12959.1 hypothetical protein IGG_06911 [Bacillus cereus HuB13-1]EOP49377.1 hypothetical protein